ncbi:hypothetical protein UFOVP708_23 [uncultured Caudovirales phage]|uniref:Uncharacterized protein n=1 Tax=uncultured Caudovirales phage TaxID=2100421 RepID=A0A6J5NM24_9CAUD|nr:hypothetical protein UFOVP708_23 [uncultured Caudovirales phage]
MTATTTVSRASTLNQLADALRAGAPVAEVRAVLVERAKGEGGAAKRAAVALSQLDAGAFGGYVNVANALYAPKAAPAPAPKPKAAKAPAKAAKAQETVFAYAEPIKDAKPAAKPAHHASVAGLRTEMNARFEAVNAGLAAINERLDRALSATARRNF